MRNFFFAFFIVVQGQLSPFSHHHFPHSTHPYLPPSILPPLRNIKNILDFQHYSQEKYIIWNIKIVVVIFSYLKWETVQLYDVIAVLVSMATPSLHCVSNDRLTALERLGKLPRRRMLSPFSEQFEAQTHRFMTYLLSVQ